MIDSVTINSINYSGESVNIIFNPDSNTKSFNLGVVNLPYVFSSNTLNPPQEIYGRYNIIVSGDCLNVLTIVRPTPTPTPTPTSSPTPTPSVTPTPTPTPSPDPCL